MPSPVGHALGGLAAGWLVGSGPYRSRGGRGWREGFLFAALGVLPDLDLLVGAHSGPTHGIGAAVVVAWLAWLGLRQSPDASWRVQFSVACGLAYGSHTLLDWLGTDTSAPIGIMAFWPLSREYHDSGLHVFMAVSRRYWQPELFWRQNLLALVRELLILVPLLVIIHRIKGRRGLFPRGD
jgi:hypothetical protein